MIKILYITYETGLIGPLVHSQFLEYAVLLSNNGIKIYILSFERKDDLKYHIDKYQEKVKYLNRNGITVYLLSRSKLPSPFPSLVDSIRGLVFGLYVSFTEKINIIHARSIIPAVICLGLKFFYWKPWIFDPRILHAEAGALAGLYPWFGRKFRKVKWLETKLASLASAVRVESIEHYNNYAYNSGQININKYRDKYFIVNNSLNLNKFYRDQVWREKIREKLGVMSEPILVYSGTLAHGRASLELFDFANELGRRFGKIHFLIISYSERAEIECLIRETQFDQNYSIVTVDHSDVFKFLSAGDFAIVFLDEKAHQHSVPLKLGEYFACGLPVVANSGVPGVEKIIKRYNVGVILEKLDSCSFLSGSKKLYNIYHEDKEINERCRKLAERKFDIQKEVNSLLKMYEWVHSRSDLTTRKREKEKQEMG